MFKILLLGSFLGLISCTSEIEVEALGESLMPSPTLEGRNLSAKPKLGFGDSGSIQIKLNNQTDKKINFNLSGMTEPFTVVENCNLEINANESCELEISFTSPGGNKSFNQELVVQFESKGKPQQLKFPIEADSIIVEGHLSELYLGKTSWYDYVKSDNGKEYNATGNLACDLSEKSALDCIHAGSMKKISLSGVNSCKDLSAIDSLGVFDWHCLNESGEIKFYSILKFNKGLKDLLNPSSWKVNSVQVKYKEIEILNTPSQVWWNDAVTPYVLISGAQNFSTSNVIYTVSSGGNYGGWHFNASHVHIVGLGSSPIQIAYQPTTYCTSSGRSGTYNCLIAIPDNGDVRYGWIENFEIDGSSSSHFGVQMCGARYFTLRNMAIKDLGAGTSIDFCTASSPRAQFNKVFNTKIYNSAGDGIRNVYSLNYFNYFEGIYIEDTGGQGVELSNANGTTIRDIEIIGSASEGIRLSNADETLIYGFKIQNSNGSGLSILNSSDVKFYDGYIANPGGAGINISNSNRAIGNKFRVTNCGNCLSVSDSSSPQETILNEFILTNGSATNGIIIHNGYEHTMTHFLSAGSAGDGLYTISGRAEEYHFSNGIFANNNGQGYEGDSSVAVGYYHNMAYINNGSHGYWNNYSGNSKFKGQIIMGGNGGKNCTAGQTVDTKCTSSGTDGSNDWTSSAAGSDARLRLSHSLLDSFFGEVILDSINTSVSLVDVQADISDWLHFENSFRMWGLAGASTNHFQSDQRGRCTGGAVDCRVWDWRLRSTASDNILYNRSGNKTAGDQENENFVGDGQTDCPSAVHGDETITNTFSTPLTYLVNALEIIDDGIGNDNGLCESNEACIYSPNIGPYQGEGDYKGNGTCKFIDGIGSNSVTNITMYAYPVNGVL